MKSFKQILNEDRNYLRVIPRDLFNEANLLKCLGALYIATEGYQHIEVWHDGKPFQIFQSQDDGSLICQNVKLYVNGEEIKIFRPLNSRDAYPLWFYDDEEQTEEEVFTNSGQLSNAFKQKFLNNR